MASLNGLALPSGNAVAGPSADKAGPTGGAPNVQGEGAVIPGVHGIVPTLQ